MSGVLSRSSWSHTALIWLIHGTGDFIAVWATFLAILALRLLGSPHYVFDVPFPDPSGWIWTTSHICFALLIAAILGGMVRLGWQMWRKITPDSIAVFALIFSLLTAVVFHYFLTISPLLGQHPLWWPWSYRATLAVIAFRIFYLVIRPYLFRVLYLSDSTSNSAPNRAGTILPL